LHPNPSCLKGMATKRPEVERSMLRGQRDMRRKRELRGGKEKGRRGEGREERPTLRICMLSTPFGKGISSHPSSNLNGLSL
jgi:hypothetical protein